MWWKIQTLNINTYRGLIGCYGLHQFIDILEGDYNSNVYVKSLGYFCSLNQCGTYIKGKCVEASTLFSRPYLFTAHKYLSSTSFFAVKIFSGVGVLQLVRLTLEKLYLYYKHIIPSKWLSLQYYKRSFCIYVISKVLLCWGFLLTFRWLCFFVFSLC